MSASTQQRKAADARIPEITCPLCGNHMRLAVIEPPGGWHQEDRMIFDCECGFEYRMSDKGQSGV